MTTIVGDVEGRAMERAERSVPCRLALQHFLENPANFCRIVDSCQPCVFFVCCIFLTLVQEMRSLHADSSHQLRGEMAQCSTRMEVIGEGIKRELREQKDDDMESLKATLHEKLANGISGIEDNMQFLAGARGGQVNFQVHGSST